MKKRAVSNKKAMSTEVLITVLITVLTIVIVLIITGKLPLFSALSKIFPGG